MKHDDLREVVARAICQRLFGPYHPKGFLSSISGQSDLAADAALAAICDAGLAIVPAVPTEAMLQAGQQERDQNAHVSEIWGAMVKAAQEGTP